MLRIVVEEENRQVLSKDLDEISREGARQMLVLALDAERAEYIERFKDQRDVNSHALVVGNAVGKERKVQLGASTVSVRAPRVNERRNDEGGKPHEVHQRHPASFYAPIPQDDRGSPPPLSKGSFDHRCRFRLAYTREFIIEQLAGS